ncbi:unnamed protein product [Gadus morhua 'NCC']
MPKSTLSQDKLQILESLWAEGVHSYRSEMDKLKVKQVAAATGLVVEQVKVWIYNRNRKKRKGGEGQMKREKSSSVLKSHSFSDEGILSSDGGHTTTPGSPVEATCSEAGREDSNRDMDLRELEEGDGSSSSGEQQEKGQDLQQHQERAIEIMQAVEDQVHKLNTCNCEVLVMVYNHHSGSLYTTGTAKGLDFLNSQTPAVHWQFSEAMSNSSSETVTVEQDVFCKDTFTHIGP